MIRSARRTAIIDPLGRRSSVVYDAMDRILTFTDANNAITHYEYDENGNLRKITDPVSRIWNAGFDSVNRLISETDPLGRTRSWLTTLAAR